MRYRFETLHLSFSDSSLLMRVLRPIVLALVGDMLRIRQQLCASLAIRAQFIGHDPAWQLGRLLGDLSDESVNCRAISLSLNQHIEHLPILIDASPHISPHPLNTNVNLVQVPAVSRRHLL